MQRSGDGLAGGATLRERFARHLQDSSLIAEGDVVLIALSGGLDSMVMLHLLLSLEESWGLGLHAAHFDHGMRIDSRDDAEWVADRCRGWGVPVTIGDAEREIDGQEDARELRYQFLERVARAVGADHIATAHHADDQVETIIFRLARGTGVQGLQGIPDRRGQIIRPLLPFRRRELEEYAAHYQVPFREDPTNTETDYTRNYLRHEVMPRLEEAVPGAAGAIQRLAENARAEVEVRELLLDAIEPLVISSESDRVIELAIDPLLSYHPQIQRLLVRRVLGRLGSVPGQRATTALAEYIAHSESGTRFHIAGGLVAERVFDHLRVCRVEGIEGRAQEDPEPLDIPDSGSGAGEVVLAEGCRYMVEWGAEAEADTGQSLLFDPAELSFPLEVRGWLPGDRIQLPYGTKKLKKLFAEHRVGRSDRHRTPILAERGGRVLWVVGLARADTALPTAGHSAFVVRVAAIES